MFVEKIKLFAICFISLGLISLAGFGSYTALAQRDDLPPPKSADVPPSVQDQKQQPTPVPLKVPKELLEKRLEQAKKVFEGNLVRMKVDVNFSFFDLFGCSERWLDAELPLVGNQDERVKAFRDHLDRTREVERLTLEFANVGGHASKIDANAATYYRVDAEIRLLKEGITPQPPKEEKGKVEKK